MIKKTDLEEGATFLWKGNGVHSEGLLYILARVAAPKQYILINMVTGGRFGEIGSIDDIYKQIDHEVMKGTTFDKVKVGTYTIES